MLGSVDCVTVPLGSVVDSFVGEADRFLLPKFVMGVAERFSSLMCPFIVPEDDVSCALISTAWTKALNTDLCCFST